MDNVFTEQLKQEILEYYSDHEGDFDDEEFNEGRQVLEECEIGKKITRFQYMFITRTIQYDDDLDSRIEACVEEEKEIEF